MAKKNRFDYFDAYEQLTDMALNESDVLIETIENYQSGKALDDILGRAHEIEHEGDQINHDIFKSVAIDFMPPIDREDIIDLAHSLDDVIDGIESVIQRFYMYNVHEMPEDALAFAQLIRKGCKALDKAMEDFRNFKKSKKFKQLIVDVNDCEEEADQLYIQVIRALHTDKTDDPLYVQVWSKLYDRMERCSDACEHVADVMNTIMLKNV